MDNVVEKNQSSRISYQNYKNRLLTVLLSFIIVLCVITATLFPVVFFVVIFSDISFSIGIFLILFCLFLLYFIYYTSKRINHAVINKLIILPFIFLLSYYVLNISNARIFYAVLYILFYMILIVIYAKYWAEKLQERKYIFNNEKYKKLADFFNINQTIENILFFRFTGSISRREYFITVLFIILVNAFIFIDLYIVAKLAYNLGYHHFGKMFYRLLNDMIILYMIVVSYAFIILLWNRLTNIFGTMKYHLIIFVLLFVIFYFTLIRSYNIEFINNYRLQINLIVFAVIIVFFGAIPTYTKKQEYDNDEHD